MDEATKDHLLLVDEQGPLLDQQRAHALHANFAGGEEDLLWTLEFLQSPLRPYVEQIADDLQSARQAAEQFVAITDYLESIAGVVACLKGAEGRLSIALCVREDKDQLISAARVKMGLSRAQ